MTCRGANWSVRYAWVANHHRKTLGAGNGDVNPVTVQQNVRPREPYSPKLDPIEKMVTGASCPWNLSTEPTRAPSGNLARSRFTCRLYGEIKGNLPMKERSCPLNSKAATQEAPRRSRAHAHPSSLDCTLPSCSTGMN